MLITRSLKDKGIREYMVVGKVIKGLKVLIRLLLAGSLEHNNPLLMSTDETQVAHNSGYIEYLVFRIDVLYKHSHVGCLKACLSL